MKNLLIILAIVFGSVAGGMVGRWYVSRTIDPVWGSRQPQVIGFLPYWLLSKASDDYSPYLTTLTYFGLVINPDGTIQKLVNPQELEPGWYKLSSEQWQTKRKAALEKGLKLSLLVHLANEEDIGLLISQPEAHAATLITEVEPVMKEQGFLDLNVDIESFREASPAARLAFTKFFATIRQELDTRQLGTLTIDISPTALVRPFLIDPIAAGSMADTVVLMTYDYHYTGSYITGPVAPLAGAGITREFDVATAITEAPKLIPRHKLVLGIPLYGYEWETLTNMPTAAVIPGSGRSATHKRVVEMMSGCSTCLTGIDATSQSPFLIFPENDYYRVTFYEDAALIQQKLQQIQAWGGTAVWALGYEDKGLLEPVKQYRESAFSKPL